jgi:CheY-like chemotaxis protein
MGTVTKRILLVDDDAAARRVYGAYLTAAGFAVEEAESGMEAVVRCEKAPFHVVVMDLDMPGLDGWMAMSLIRARRPNLPMIILSALTDAEVRQRAHKAGADFVGKPASQDELTRSVRRLVD